MSSSNFFRVINTLAFRLTVLYAGIFTLSFLGMVLFLNIQTNLARKERTAQETFRDAKKFSFIMVLKNVEELDTGIVLESGDEELGKAFYRIESGEASDDGSLNWPSLRLVPDESALQKFNSSPGHFFQTLFSADTPRSASIRYSVTDKEDEDKKRGRC